MKAYIITFDIGGTRIKYGIVTAEGELLRSETLPSEGNEGAESMFAKVSACINDIKTAEEGELKGIGLGLTGGVDPNFGVVLLPGKFKDLEGFPIVRLLEERFNVPVFAENDGRLAAYAEKYYGKAKSIDWAVVVTIGTGVGSGVILDGKILIDPHLMFGTQLGHLITNKSDDRICLTGNHGTGELQSSCTALALQVRSALQRGIPSVLTDDYYADPFSIDFHRVIEACRMGDQICLKEFDVWLNSLAILLINAVHCYAPQVIILSGGATLAADIFLEKLQTIVNKQVFRYPAQEPVAIVVSEMQEYAGVMGAAAMFMENLKKYRYERVD